MYKSVTQEIYEWLKNIYGISYNDTIKVKDDSCYLCGGDTNGIGLPIKKAFSSNFTNQEFAKNHDSKSVCEACAFWVKQEFVYYNPNKNKDSKLHARNMSWVITPDHSYPKLTKEKNIIRLSEVPNPKIIRNFLLKKDLKDFVVLYSTSGQKHLFFRLNIINRTKNQFEIIFEEETLNLNYDVFIKLLSIVESLMTFGFSKLAIQNIAIFHKDIPTDIIKPIVDILSFYKDNPILDFILKIAIKEEKPTWQIYKKILESMDLEQKQRNMQSQVKSSTQSIDQETKKDSQQKHQKVTGEPLKPLSKNQQGGQQLLFDL
jgi:hypothetical protein